MAPLLRRTLALATLAALPGLARAADLYKVEVVVFSHQDPAALAEEYWPERPPLALDAGVYPQPWDGYPLTEFEELAPNDLELAGAAATLARQPDYQLLYHRGWLQPIAGPAQTRAVRIRAQVGDTRLDGLLKLHKNRYLHARPQLELSEPAAPLPPTPGAPEPVRPLDTDGTAPLTLVTAAPLTEQRWQLDQSRRMRSKETHYIDHPRFGVLLHIRPLEQP